MREAIKVAFASGSEDLIPTLIERMKELHPELPLYVVSEFPPPEAQWVPYHVARSLRENFALCRSKFRGRRIRLCAVILQPRMPYWRMRLIALLLSPAGFIAFNENLDNFMLRPRCLGTLARHFLWRTSNLIRWELRPGGATYTFFWRIRHPGAYRRPLLYLVARLAGCVIAAWKAVLPPRALDEPGAALPEGVSVVVPSRDGKDLLAKLLPGLKRELGGIASEIIVVDNGSSDGTTNFLRGEHPGVLFEYSPRPLAFAAAANGGLARARYSRTCLLNNDMTLEEGFFGPLLEAFDRVPDLFAATAQIMFPEGARREETGKAVMPARPPASRSEAFPVRCDLPVPGENLSYVLYGSGGCSLYDTAKLRRLGGFDEIYQPAYVEDLDAGYRAWRQGWPTVFVSGARVLHQHRVTTARFYSAERLERILEVNYLRFLVRAVAAPALFRKLWHEALQRLNQMAARVTPSEVAVATLREARNAPLWFRRPFAADRQAELQVLALGSGDVAVFPGRSAGGRGVILLAAPYLPFPLSHGGAVRIFNLMRRAARDYDQVLIAFTDRLVTPPPELLEVCAEIVLVRRLGTHLRRSTERPDEVEAYASAAFQAAMRQTVRKWRPFAVQLEYTQMAQYAAAGAPARTILVEHDITYDLYEQLLARGEDWEARRQLERWRKFERAAWGAVDRVVTMSEKDRDMVVGGHAVCLPNGVDLGRFRPSGRAFEPARLLFIGSFAHLPNILAVEFFLREVWPLVAPRGAILHIIAGARHKYYLEHSESRTRVDLRGPGLVVEDFVADVRPAYERATVVVAPLVASAGTNIKIMEAMAMGKAVVSTPAGINGLDLSPGRDVIVVSSGEAMARAIIELLDSPGRRVEIEREARATVEREFDWDVIAHRQEESYESLRAMTA